ncbi:hypothetical protein EVAR_25412_1 [Eumeta japonica]|uniref:Uncharacterized protein n=1 Tax=Eumeta variegata TaxID=151549 RepID=A0A4C1V4U9_EUMVA|nr:hypothetical protein EVAR_25412_1 [Eumeta japonica]
MAHVYGGSRILFFSPPQEWMSDIWICRQRFGSAQCSIAEAASARNISSNIFACTGYCRGFITDERPRTNIASAVQAGNVKPEVKAVVAEAKVKGTAKPRPESLGFQLPNGGHSNVSSPSVDVSLRSPPLDGDEIVDELLKIGSDDDDPDITGEDDDDDLDVYHDCPIMRGSPTFLPLMKLDYEGRVLEKLVPELHQVVDSDGFDAYPSTSAEMQTDPVLAVSEGCPTITTFGLTTAFNMELTEFPAHDEYNISEVCREQFLQQTGPTSSYAIPYDAFVAIWDHTFVEIVVKETNTFAS